MKRVKPEWNAQREWKMEFEPGDFDQIPNHMRNEVIKAMRARLDRKQRAIEPLRLVATVTVHLPDRECARAETATQARKARIEELETKTVQELVMMRDLEITHLPVGGMTPSSRRFSLTESLREFVLRSIPQSEWDAMTKMISTDLAYHRGRLEAEEQEEAEWKARQAEKVWKDVSEWRDLDKKAAAQLKELFHTILDSSTMSEAEKDGVRASLSALHERLAEVREIKREVLMDLGPMPMPFWFQR